MSAGVAPEELKGLGGTTGLLATSIHHEKQNAWSGPGPAAFDFRSMSSLFFKLSCEAQKMLMYPRRCSDNPNSVHARRHPEYYAPR